MSGIPPQRRHYTLNPKPLFTSPRQCPFSVLKVLRDGIFAELPTCSLCTTANEVGCSPVVHYCKKLPPLSGVRKVKSGDNKDDEDVSRRVTFQHFVRASMNWSDREWHFHHCESSFMSWTRFILRVHNRVAVEVWRF